MSTRLHLTIGPLGPAPTRLELETFDEIVNQSILSAQVGAGLELPWEQGIFRAIFSEEPLCSLPEIPIPTQAISVNRSDGVLDERLAEQPSGKRQKCSQYIHGLYDRAISFSHGLSDHELDAAKWARVLEKLYTIFTCCPEAKPVGLDLHPADMAGNFKRIRELCGSPQLQHSPKENQQSLEVLQMAPKVLLSEKSSAVHPPAT